MQRRARIKAVANLSASRKNTNKSSTEISKKTSEIEIDDPTKIDLQKRSSDDLPETSQHISLSSNVSPQKINIIQDLGVEVSNESEAHETFRETISSQQNMEKDQPVSLKNENATFKAPLKMPRNESETSGSNVNKNRRLKVAPRLNALRNVVKVQEHEDTYKQCVNQNDFARAVPVTSLQESLYDFATPIPSNDVPLFIVNNNVQPSAAPPSPFPHFSHSRIRTESLCSVKSNRDVTMANLQPRKNIRTEDQKIIDIKRESRERLSKKDLDKSQLRMFDMIYFNPQSNPMKPRSPHKHDRTKKIESKPIESEVEKESLTAERSIPVPQLKIDSNGDMVLDETSLVVENEQQKQNRLLLANANVVYDDELSGNYGYYKRQQRTKEWPHEETVKFYRCLNTVGTDFSLMLNLFPNRTRRDLKLKFKKEERNNPQLIDKALLKHNTFDLDELQRELDQEEEDRRKDSEMKSKSEVKELVKRKILKKQEAKLKFEQQSKTNVEKILSDGELAISIVNSKLLVDLKENMEVSYGSPGTKRQYKKKVKTVNPDEALTCPTPIMEGLESEDIKPVETIIKTKRSREPSKKSINITANISIMSTPNTLESHGILKKPRKAMLATNNQPEIDGVCTENDTERGFVLSVDLSTVKSIIKTEFCSQSVPFYKIMEGECHLENPLATTAVLLSPATIQVESSYQYENQVPLNFEELPVPDDENLNATATLKHEMAAATSVAKNLIEESFDEEAFLNSLDLEKLVLVEAQRKGKDVYEIHEIDSVTQEICDKPIDLPTRYVDLILSVMTQQENDS